MGGSSGIGRRRTAAREDSSEPYQRRRREIAQAAVRVFNRVGLKGASISAVAAELEIDRASLYYYFASKEDLFDAVVREVIEELAALVRGVRDDGTAPPSKLRALVTGLMGAYGRHYPLVYIYLRENLGRVGGEREQWSKHMRRLNREIEDDVIAIVEQGYADGSLRRVGSPRVVAYGLLGIVGWTHRWFRPATSEVSAEEIGATYAAMLLAGLGVAGRATDEADGSRP